MHVNSIHGKETPLKRQEAFPTAARNEDQKMTRSAREDPEVSALLKELEELGYPTPIPEGWGAKRAKRNLKVLISAVTPGLCPICKRKTE